MKPLPITLLSWSFFLITIALGILSFWFSNYREEEIVAIVGVLLAVVSFFIGAGLRIGSNPTRFFVSFLFLGATGYFIFELISKIEKYGTPALTSPLLKTHDAEVTRLLIYISITVLSILYLVFNEKVRNFFN